MDKQTSSKPLIIAGTILVLISLPLAIFFGVKREQKYVGRATYPVIKPKNIKISNKHARGFTVSWTTSQKTTGKIQFCKQNSGCTDTANFNDDRKVQDEISSYTHHVTVKSKTEAIIEPNQTYYFRIISGDNGIFGASQVFTVEETQFKDTNVIRNGIGFFIKTPSIPSPSELPRSLLPPNHPYGAYSIENPLPSNSCSYGSFLPCPDGTDNPPQTCCFRPNPIYGTVKNSASQPENDVIIYFYIKKGNQVVSTRLSSISRLDPNTQQNGAFNQNIANFYKKDLTNYLAYTPGQDKLLVEALSPENQTAEQEYDIPETISDQCLSTPLNCQTAPNDPTNPIQLALKPPAEPTLTITPPPIPLSPTPSPTPPNGCNKPRDLDGDGNIDGMDIGEVIKDPFPVGLSASDPVYDDTRDNYRDLDCNNIIDGMDIGAVTIDPFPVFTD